MGSDPSRCGAARRIELNPTGHREMEKDVSAGPLGLAPAEQDAWFGLSGGAALPGSRQELQERALQIYRRRLDTMVDWLEEAILLTHQLTVLGVELEESSPQGDPMRKRVLATRDLARGPAANEGS